jgi:hypothetical protein
MVLNEKMSRRKARAMGNAWWAERALGNRLGSEQKRPSFGYFYLAERKVARGFGGGAPHFVLYSS